VLNLEVPITVGGVKFARKIIFHRIFCFAKIG